ncbi:hypothetical protein SAM23877_3008 [Streptomyces ambofaciens ATCC 23877]|uniref:Uncharacterized protein n=1 Tax=Streptomyces ambofaciens (strain ATCC 23877 / 3486 / DSM 40053 / JCM 4204 / NBRC 12836 / NRRL B-2516) TaxID=278992 RepID=A0A0K2ATC3_STRA7|nr:hypothetical protein SAM23877_3008 [Streptomyces ambofaciens ATCC 23877]
MPRLTLANVQSNVKAIAYAMSR